MIHDERAMAADMLEGLTPEQWRAASLCDGWSVREMAAHIMVAAEQSTGHFLMGLTSAGFRFDTMTDREAKSMGQLEPTEIVRRIRARTTTTNKPPAPAMASRVSAVPRPGSGRLGYTTARG